MDKIWTDRAARLADQAGPFLLGTLACTGVFARGLANMSFGLLALWGLWIFTRNFWFQAEPPPSSPADPSPPAAPPWPPARWAVGLAFFSLT